MRTVSTRYYYATVMSRSYHYNDDDVEERTILVKLSTDKDDVMPGLMKAAYEVFPPTVGQLVGIINYEEAEAPIEIQDGSYHVRG